MSLAYPSSSCSSGWLLANIVSHPALLWNLKSTFTFVCVPINLIHYAASDSVSSFFDAYWRIGVSFIYGSNLPFRYCLYYLMIISFIYILSAASPITLYFWQVQLRITLFKDVCLYLCLTTTRLPISRFWRQDSYKLSL